jgi:hypothetical protein
VNCFKDLKLSGGLVKWGSLAALLLTFIILLLLAFGWVHKRIEEKRVLLKVIERLSADSRVAEVLVIKSVYIEDTKEIETTIKFLEYDSAGKPLPPKYFTFRGNLIQFQCLVMRFEDKFVRSGDKLRGKSACLFLKAFVLKGEKTQECVITPTDQIPAGYKVPGLQNEYEKTLWKEFWNYALNPASREKAGIKNAQIEAPGSMFLPGTIYTIKLEHAGGIRIDTKPIPEILKGEKISKN